VNETSGGAGQHDHLVLFMPSGKRGRFAAGTPVLDAARSLGVYIESVCGGRGICGRCQIQVAEGKFAKHGIESRADHLAGVTATETRYRDKRGLADDRRLSCAALIEGDLVIDVPQDVQVTSQVVRKRAESRRIPRDPLTRLAYVEIGPPDIDRPLGDTDRLIAALVTEWGYEGIVVDTALLGRVQEILRVEDFKVTAAVHESPTGPILTGLFPGFRDRLYGLAVDIGSTTIAAHVCDMMSGRTIASSGTANPQIRFGEDLMSRVSYVMMNPDGQVAMTAAVREAVNTLAERAAGQAGVALDEILEAVFVGNPIMHHLFLGIDPKELGFAPFALAVSGPLDFPAREIGLALPPSARVYTLPCIAGHVGADAAAATLAEGPHRSPETTLLVDVGTNAEIILGSELGLVAASSPTGPAFEGAEISCGQRAAPGAIERVRIDRQTLEPRIKVIGADVWSDEEGFAEAVELTGVTGVCGSGIIEAIAEMFLSGILDADGVIDGTAAEKSARVQANGRTFSYRLWEDKGLVLTVSQADVRAIQLAKAALYAGVKLLMDRQGLETVDRIKLAGAFGSYIDPVYAMVLGLVPDCDPKNIKSVGNAAGTGARMALLNRDYREEIERVVRQIEKVETATEARFQEHFVNAMAFPNKVDAFPNLARAVDLPQPKPGRDGSGPQRRRGRRNR